jgi:hypothetical protein
MSLAKFIAQQGPEALKWLQANKQGLGLAAGGTAALGAGAVAAKPMVEDYMTDRAIDAVGQNIKGGIVDALEFAEEHPYATAAVVGGAGLLGAKLGDQGFASMLDTISPIQISQLFNSKKQRRRR